MESPQFLRQLLLISALTALGIWALSRVPALVSGIPLAWMSLLFFVVFSLLTYLAAIRATRNTKKERFVNLVLGFTIIKMIFSFVLIAAYAKWAEPDSRLFALPFFGVYLIFTIFESAFMIRVGRS